MRGSALSLAASLLTLTLGLGRAVLLARLVLPEAFGVFTIGTFFLALFSQLQTFGFDYALIHRADADEALRRTYLSLRVGLALLVTLLLALAAWPLGLLYPSIPELSALLVALAAVGLVMSLSTVMETMLSKALAFRQLATMDVAGALAASLVAPALALAGWGLWALVGELAAGVLMRLVLGWVAFRPWRPRLGWNGAAARWFWQYGRPVWGSSMLYLLVDRFDDFWIGTTLGKAPLGYYSRAYEFAHYPRRIVANPLISVFNPVFASLQTDRERLSQAFYRATYVVLRGQFALAGAFALLLPEFIALVIGPRWEPMLPTFRLMLVYTIFDSLWVLGGALLYAVGRPAAVLRVGLVQVALFVPGTILGAATLGIEGVALAADAMMLVGCLLLLAPLRASVDFSAARLAWWPSVALVLALVAGLLAEQRLALEPLLLAPLKLTIFSLVFGAVLLLAEGRELLQGVRWTLARLRPTQGEAAT